MAVAGISFSKDVVPLVAMITVEVSLVGLNTIFKAATLQGMSYHAFAFYSYAVASLLLLPLALLFPTTTTALLPPFTFNIFCKFCMLALIGVSAQLLGYAGVNYSSPTMASAIGNLSPAFTFILAVVFRMERVDFRSSVTRAKIMGTLLLISGAFVVVFYKGPILIPSRLSPSHHQQPQHLQSSSMDPNWILGGLLLASQRFFFSLWYITQTHIMKLYPAELLVILLQNICCTFNSLPVCLLGETDLAAWRLELDLALAAIVYSYREYSDQSSAMWYTAVYISIFKPFSIVIAAFMTVLFLGDELCLGSVIGAVIISAGFYAVIWRKNEEADDGDEGLGSSSKQTIPLLKDNGGTLA